MLPSAYALVSTPTSLPTRITKPTPPAGMSAYTRPSVLALVASPVLLASLTLGLSPVA